MASNEDILNKISVKDVAKKFLIKSDEILANKLQTEECFDHFKKNRFLKQVNRENIQKSIPLAKTIETVENQKFMNTRISHEHQKEIEQRDELIAYELHQQYLNELELEQQRKDEELAKMLQQEEILNDPIHIPVSTTTYHKNLNINYNNDESYYHDPDDEDDDYSLAMYLQQEEQKKIELQNQKHAVLLDDEELARRLQESENSRLNGNLYSTHQKVRKY